MRDFLDRLVTAFASVLAAMLLIFVLMSVVPGDPASTLLGPQASPEFVRQYIQQMGLDQPVHIRLGRFFGNLLTGNLGTDVVSGRPVWDIIAEAMPNTVMLALFSMTAACIIGIPLGVFGVMTKSRAIDAVLTSLSIVFVSMPSFIVGIALLVIFSSWLNWLPVLGAPANASLVDKFRAMILPTTALAIGWVGIIGRLVRSSMLEALSQNYIRTARAYGLNKTLVFYKYALRNAIIPTITVVGMGFARLIGGAVLVEVLFARQGLGTVIYDALISRNFSVLQGSIFVVVVLFVFINFVTEYVFRIADPRFSKDTA
ncbi:ABC transporter permease [Devosia sp. YIM 151766]|uniref:ABC transporter permease n=1 Tax=Devosia sp. YIM 151766 TaxID=3017325 RepID=UPI00255CF0D4|nr:ABC transporter permease [Devosia sp. YIM 151766]WIY54542.1 ABC transporter permease [Devosia sp. YIM 151766]